MLTLTSEGGAGHSVIRMKLPGISPHVQVEGVGKLVTKTNYFSGADPAGWVTGVPQYAAVRYRGVYPCVDLVFRQSEEGIEYDWVVAPGGDFRRIRMIFEGVDGLDVNSDGALVARSNGMVLRSGRPIGFQGTDPTRERVGVQYRIGRKKREARFSLLAYDPAKTLVIDPVLTYSAVFGGSGFESHQNGLELDVVRGIAVDSSGNAYIVGTAYSQDFSALNSTIAQRHGVDAFVAKVDPKGSLKYVSFLGSAFDDTGSGVAVDAAGNVYVTGTAGGPDFPVFNALQPKAGGGGDGFVAKLNPAGSALIYSTFLGGNSYDTAQSIALDAGGFAYVAGSTNSSDFPVTAGVLLPTMPATVSAFLTKISPNGGLVYSTFLGEFSGPSVAVDPNGNAFIAGSTSASNLPTTPGVLQSVCRLGPNSLCADAYIVKVNQNATAFIYATFLGGHDVDQLKGIAVDAGGNLYVAGYTASSDFPTTPGSFQTVAHLNQSLPLTGFIAKVNATGTALVYSSFLGGSTFAAASAVAVDSAGNAYVTGDTSDTDFPLVRPLQASLGGGTCFAFGPQGGPLLPCSDAFITKVNPQGSTLVWSTYFGGADHDGGGAIAISGGNVYVTGLTASPDLPTTVATGNPRGSVLALRISESSDAPVFTAASVTNAASFASALTPGSLATVFGLNLSSASGIVSAEGFPLPTQIDGSSLTINGIAAPLLAVANVNGREQINFVVPWEIAAQPSATLVISNHGVSSLPVRVPVIAAQPGIFTIDGLHAAAQHSSDYSLITNTHPAQPGEIILLYATGLGAVSPAVATGERAPALPLSKTIVTPTVLIGGSAANVRYSGLVPGYVGLYQLNVLVPQGVAAGDLDVLIQIGGNTGNTVKLPVQAHAGT